MHQPDWWCGDVEQKLFALQTGGWFFRIRAASWTGLCRICELSGCGLRLKHFAAVVVMLFLLEKFLTRQLPRQWLLVAAAPNHGRFVPGAGNYGTCRRGNHFFLVVPRFFLYALHDLTLMRVKSGEGSRIQIGWILPVLVPLQQDLFEHYDEYLCIPV